MVTTTVAVSSPHGAELAKLIENIFRHVNIALVTSWRCSRASSASTCGRRSTPRRRSRGASCGLPRGPGVGCHCLPIDPSYLSWRVERTVGQCFRFVELANDINGHMPDYVVRRLMLALNKRGLPVSGSLVLLLGLAYKKNTGDARESPAIRVANLLLRMGAVVRAADPLVTETAILDPAVTRVVAAPEEIAAADLVVLLTDHDAFSAVDIGRHARHVLDCRRVLSGPNVETL